MRNTLSMIGACAVIALGAANAFAGPCTSEITKLEQSAGMKDAGSGPTPGASGGSAASSSATATAQERPGSAMQAGDKSPERAGTPAMNETVGNRAASPADVRAQIQGQPTAAQQAQGKEVTGSTSADPKAMAMLQDARTYDAQGQEARCMDAVTQAKQMMK